MAADLKGGDRDEKEYFDKYQGMNSNGIDEGDGFRVKQGIKWGSNKIILEISVPENHDKDEEKSEQEGRTDKMSQELMNMERGYQKQM